MSRQLERIHRLIEIRQREVDGEVRQLAATQQEVIAAAAVLNAARDALQQALDARRDMAGGVMVVEEWRSLEDWLETLGVRQSLAAHRLATAHAHERRARARVAQAHKKKKQAEALLARLLRERDVQLLRADRRQEDESAQRVGRRQHSSDDS